MSEGTSGDVHVSAAGQEPAATRPVLEPLDEAECLRLISPGGIGRLAYTGRYGLTVFPVNYKLHDGSIMFRTSEDSPTDEDLRTGIAHAEYEVAFEIDDIDPVSEIGWKRVNDVSEVLTVGDEISVVLKSIDWENDKFSFSLKDTLPDP